MLALMTVVPLTLLGLLERQPSHGYDLKRDYDAFFGRGKPLPFGQVYSTLGRLARDGKVTGGDAEPGAGPDRKRYVITESGVTDMLSMPSATRNAANSGKSDGPWPQMPTLTPHFFAVRMRVRRSTFTASLRSS